MTFKQQLDHVQRLAAALSGNVNDLVTKCSIAQAALERIAGQAIVDGSISAGAVETASLALQTMNNTLQPDRKVKR